MILTDREIRIAIQDKAVKIDPIPDLSVAITSTAIDLTLSDVFREWNAMSGITVCPGKPGYSYSACEEISNRTQSAIYTEAEEFRFGLDRGESDDPDQIAISGTCRRKERSRTARNFHTRNRSHNSCRLHGEYSIGDVQFRPS